MERRKTTRIKVAQKGVHLVNVVNHLPKGSLRKYLTKQREAEQLAVLEGIRRIADLASGKVQGLTEKQWKKELRRGSAEKKSGKVRSYLGKTRASKRSNNTGETCHAGCGTRNTLPGTWRKYWPRAISKR